jgi:hypothetical protein
MKKLAIAAIALTLTAASLAIAGCGSNASLAGDNETSPPPAQAKQPVIEEPDLYRWEGNTLYVQNPQTGLNILDVTDASKPRLLGRAPVTGGAGAEIYIKKGNVAIVLLKTATSLCTQVDQLDPEGWSLESEAAFVEVTEKTHPRVLGRYCLPGTFVASRTVDDVMYIVTTAEGRGSRAISVDISNPARPRLVQSMMFANASKEIIVTPTAIMVAGKVTDNYNTTRVGYISITASGKMTTRDWITVPGQPQGRFHMNVSGTQFRIVTYDSFRRVSLLSVLDTSDPDNMKVIGQLGDIGRGEQLKATRFDGDKAYVVTFRQTDPLWIISLSDPSKPRMVGQLQVPGWSDFLFPRGDRLIAVGRGARGMYLGVSLFDVSDPSKPRSLHQIELGSRNSTSEANVDHRGVTIIDLPRGNPLLVVPHTHLTYRDGCTVQDVLQLVEVQSDKLKARGSVGQKGTIRRSLLLKDRLYSISDYEVLSLDIQVLDNPRVDTAVTVGTDPEAGRDGYRAYCGGGGPGATDIVWDEEEGFGFLCTMGDGAGRALPPVSMLGLLALLALRRRRR